jgi:hypothetical protein
MIKMLSRVYHTGVRANGVVIDHVPLIVNQDGDHVKNYEPYKVRFFWAKYCDIMHGDWNERMRTGTKWQWCSGDNLIETTMSDPINKVTSIGGRSLDRLVRNVCEIDRRERDDGSDIVMVYGQSNHAIPNHMMALNRNLIINKMEQCQMMGEELAPRVWDSVRAFPNRNCPNAIMKPYQSMGGKGIERWNGHDGLPYGFYLQEEFNKVREFRAHCFLWCNTPVMMVQEKVIEDTNQLCWNKKQGGGFRTVFQPGMTTLHYDIPLELLIKLSGKSIEALKKLKYDFGGVDLGMDAEGNIKIFEVNSRMGLREQSLFTYKRVINELRTLDIDSYTQERWV